MKQVKESTAKRKRDRHKSNMPRIQTLRKSKKYRAQTHDKFKKGKKWQKFYGSKVWRDLRAAKLADQPICERCLKHDIIRAATEVHHKKVFGSFPTETEQWYWFLDYNNLVSLCHQCHQYVHQHGDADFIERFD